MICKGELIKMQVHKLGFSIMQLLAYAIVARFSCSALANIRIFSMGFTFMYGILFIILFAWQYRNITREEFSALFSLIVYTFFVAAGTITHTGNIFNTFAFNAYVLVFFFFVYMYMKRIEEKEAIRISLLGLCGYIFTYIYSIVLLIQNPALSRQAAANMITENSIDKLGAIGGFDTVFGTLIVLIFIIYLLGSSTTSGIKIISIITAILGCAFLVLASYGTAVMLFVVSIVLILYRKNLLLSIAMVVIVIAMYVNRVNIGEFIFRASINIDFSDILKEKIQDMATIMVTGESTGSLSGDRGRIARMGWSLSTFAQYPLLGAYVHGLDNIENVLVGGHSEIIDTLARFGLFGTVMIVSFFTKLFKSGIQVFEEDAGRKCYWVAIIIYTAIAVLDPALYAQQVLPFFVLLPFFEYFTHFRKEL